MHKSKYTKTGSRRATGWVNRTGAATVELAVCIPVIVILAFGSMECASTIFHRQALVQSAYETCKEAVKARGSEALALQRGQEVLDFRGITGQTITMNPANTETLARGTLVTVTVSAPSDSNSILPFGPFSGQTMEVTATMQKE